MSVSFVDGTIDSLDRHESTMTNISINLIADVLTLFVLRLGSNEIETKGFVYFCLNLPIVVRVEESGHMIG